MDPPATVRRIRTVLLVNMTTTQRARANANLATAVEHVIVPRAGKLPSNPEMLLAGAILSWCPVKSVARRAQADHIACLISETLVEAGV